MSVRGVKRLAGLVLAGVVTAVTAPVLPAAPTVRSAMLRFGGSPRLPAGEWVYLTYELANPDPEPATVRLSLRATERGRSVYDRTVTVAPGCTLRSREAVVADPTGEYVLSLFVGDERIQRETVVAGNTDTLGTAALMFLNDGPGFTVPGEFLKNGLLREPIGFASVTAREAPSHWAGYGHVRVVVIGLPRFRDLSSVQYGALAAYVEHGGSVLFAAPEGTLEAASTPWAALLPVSPLRIRLVEALPELDAWGAELGDTLPATDGQARHPLADRDGFPLLESSAVGDGLTVLTGPAGPLIRWRRCGLGRVGVMATDPCAQRLVDSGVFAPLWNHVLCYTQPVFALRNLENSQSLPTVLSHLTGFTVPGAGAVGGVLFGYVVCLLGVLIGGFLWRRHVVSWLLAATLGVLLTAVIFAWAFRQNANRTDSRAIVLDLRFSGDRRCTGHSIISLFATKDLRPSVKASASTCRLRPLPSPARGRRREPLDAPLIVHRGADLAGLPAIAVQALKPREFAAEYEGLPETVAPIRMTLGEQGPVFAAGAPAQSRVPPGADLFVLTGNELVPISADTLRGGGRLAGGVGLVDADPFVTDLRRYLAQGAFPRPAVVCLQAWQELPDRALAVAVAGFGRDGYALRWLPLALEAAAGPVRVPPELLRVEPARSGARLLVVFGAAQESTVLRAPRAVLAYDVVLPPVLAELRPAEVTVDLDLANAGGNVAVDVRVTRVPASLGSPATETEALRLWESAVPATAVEGGSFRFGSPLVAALIRPHYSRFRLLVELSQRQLVSEAPDAERTNRWRLNRLNVALSGTLPPAAETRKL